MNLTNKEILQKANTAITEGRYEDFLAFCTEDTEWIFIGDQTLKGKEAVRQYMKEAYKEPPKFMVENFIAEGDHVTAVGKISLKNKEGKSIDYSYCDVWKFTDGKMAKLKAFVIEEIKN
jgi:ketosteroid isomerase-like protein